MPDENNPLAKVEAITKKQPWYVWAGGIATAGVVGWYILKNRAAQAAKAATPADPNAMTPADQNAIDNGYQLASMAGMPYGYVSDNGPVDNYPSVPPGGTPPTPPTPTPTPIPPAPTGVAGVNYGLIPFGQYAGPSYSNLKAGTTYTWNGIKYLLSTGPQGKLYGKDPAGKTWLLYEPASFYPGGTNYTPPFMSGNPPVVPLPHGGGGMGSPWQSMLNSGRNTIDQHAAAMGLTRE